MNKHDLTGNEAYLKELRKQQSKDDVVYLWIGFLIASIFFIIAGEGYRQILGI